MIIERKEYLEKLIAWKDKQLIKIVTGVRRCGKSMLLEIYRNYLKEHGIEEEQIISINFENGASHSRYFSLQIKSQY